MSIFDEQKNHPQYSTLIHMAKTHNVHFTRRFNKDNSEVKIHFMFDTGLNKHDSIEMKYDFINKQLQFCWSFPNSSIPGAVAWYKQNPKKLPHPFLELLSKHAQFHLAKETGLVLHPNVPQFDDCPVEGTLLPTIRSMAYWKRDEVVCNHTCTSGIHVAATHFNPNQLIQEHPELISLVNKAEKEMVHLVASKAHKDHLIHLKLTFLKRNTIEQIPYDVTAYYCTKCKRIITTKQDMCIFEDVEHTLDSHFEIHKNATRHIIPVDVTNHFINLINKTDL